MVVRGTQTTIARGRSPSPPCFDRRRSRLVDSKGEVFARITDLAEEIDARMRLEFGYRS